MRILTSSKTLDYAGLPTFTLTMYNEFVRRGHNVIVYSPLGGRLESKMNVIKDIDKLPVPDVIIAQHNTCAIELRKKFPNIHMVFYSHGLLPEIEQPPKVPMDYYFVINEEVRKNLINKKIPKGKIEIVRDFIDIEKFKPEKPINEQLEKVLFISNYRKSKNFRAVDGACKLLRVDLKCCGATYGRCFDIEEEINKVDLVISWGRGILEAMSCGRAVLSFDKEEGDGYITPETYFTAREDNFSGRIYKHNFNEKSLAKEMLKYNSACAGINRELVLFYHNAQKGVDQIQRYLLKL